MIVLRYLYVVALVVWLGGMVAAGAIVAPAMFAVLQAEAGARRPRAGRRRVRRHPRRVLTTSAEVAGAVMLVTMTVLRLLGPKPTTFGVRAVLLGAMLGAAAYTGHVVLPKTEALRREMALPSQLPPPTIRGACASTSCTSCRRRLMMAKIAGGPRPRRLGSARVARPR